MVLTRKAEHDYWAHHVSRLNTGAIVPKLPSVVVAVAVVAVAVVAIPSLDLGYFSAIRPADL